LIWGKKVPPFGLYIVASGAVTILLPDLTHVELGSGEFFGEMYLLNHDVPEDFEVRSLGYSKILCLPAKDFDHLMAQDPTIKAAIELVAKQRLRALEVWRAHQPDVAPTETLAATPAATPAARPTPPIDQRT
jgi:CPA1 family monovalent cation:H+ antiporter